MLLCLDRAGAEDAPWTDRLIPLPQETRLAGTDNLAAADIRWRLTFTGLQAGAIGQILHPLPAGTNGRLQVVFHLSEQARGAAPDALLERLRALPNAGQAYLVYPATNPPAQVRIIANTGIGLLYGARTLAQLWRLQADPPPAGDAVRAWPLAEILDWPDMAERGLWGDVERFAPWLAQWKINLMETRLRFDANGEVFSYFLTNAAAREAASYGFHMTPFFAHPDKLLNFNPFLLTPAGRQAWPGVLATNNRALCFSSANTIRLLAGWMDAAFRLLRQADPSARPTVSMRTTETRKPDPCGCAQCRQRTVYENETAAFLAALRLTQSNWPDAFLRINLSQGTFAYNDRLIELVRGETGGHAGLVFYDSKLTYRVKREPMIYPLLEEYSGAGGWLSAVPVLSPSWFTIFPWTGPSFVKYRLQECAEKHLQSVTAYFVPSIWYYQCNAMALAEWGWNARGRTPREFARAYASAMGIPDPKLFAEWALLAGEAGWDLAASGIIARIAGDPSLWLERGQVFSHDLDDRFADDIADNRISRFDQALRNAVSACYVARQAGVPDMLDESHATLAALRALDVCAEIQPILVNTNRGADARAQLAQGLELLDRCAYIINSRVYDWAARREADYDHHGHYARLNHTAVGLLRTCDIFRERSRAWDIADPRPASRARPLEIRNRQSTNGVTIYELAVPDQAAADPGSYHVCFDRHCVIEHVEVYGQDAEGQQTLLGRSPEPEPNGITGARFLECRINLPPVASGNALSIKVYMRGEQAWDGTIGLRRTWSAADAPWPVEEIEKTLLNRAVK